MAKYTKKAILDTFAKLLNEKPLSKITVKEIIEECEINRNTFYYYFEDINALTAELMNGELAKAGLEPKDGSLTERLMPALQFVIANRKPILNIYNSFNRADVERYLFDVLGQTTEAFVRSYSEGSGASEDEILLISRYHMYAMVGIVIDWLSSGDEDIEYMLGRICCLTEESVRDYFKKAVEAVEILNIPPQNV